jgi:hypothetical protein
MNITKDKLDKGFFILLFILICFGALVIFGMFWTHQDFQKYCKKECANFNLDYYKEAGSSCYCLKDDVPINIGGRNDDVPINIGGRN